MKKYDHLSKAELIRRLTAMERITPGPAVAFAHERLLHDLQVQQVELETQNRELREAQQVLELSRERYADLYDFAPVGYLTLDDKGVIREINLTAAAMLGIERTRLVGTPFHLHVMREDLPEFRQHLPKNLQPDQHVTSGFRLRRKRRTPLAVAMQSVGVRAEDGGGCVCRAALTDVSELRQAELALLESAELNRAILGALTAHIAVVDQEGTIIAVNDAWSRFAAENGDPTFAHTGVGNNYLQICRKSAAVSDADAEAAMAGIQSVLHGSKLSFRLEYPCHSPRVRRWFLMSVTRLATARGGAVISHTDITERHLVEEAISEKEARLRAILDTAHDGIVTIDERGIIKSFNQAAEKMFGYSAIEVIGQNVKLLMPPPYHAAHAGYLENYHATGERKMIGIGREAEGRRKDGSSFPLDIAVSEVQLADRRIFTGILRDITERQRAEAALRASEERFRSLCEAAPLGICLSDAAGACVYTNPRWQEMSGLSAEENLGEGWTSVIHPDDRAGLFAAWAEALGNGGELAYDFRILRRDGSERWIRSRTRPIAGAQGQTLGYVGVDEDISESKRDELRRRLQYETARLLAAAGSLAEIVPKFLQTVAETFHWDVGEFWEMDEATQKLRVVQVWHAPGQKKLAAFVRHSQKLAVSMFDGLPGRVIETGRPDWIAEIADCPHFPRREAAAKAGLRSALAFPIVRDHRPLGVMAFLAHRVTEPDADLLEVFGSVGRQIGQFIEREKAERELRAERDFTSAVLETAGALVIVLDESARIVRFNRACEQLTGYTAEEVVGKAVWDLLLPPEDLAAVQAVFGKLRSAQFTVRHDNCWLTKSGERRLVSWSNTVLTNPDGSVRYIIGTGIDITDRRRLEAELLEISDYEQRRIGQDLHDDICQQLAGIEFRVAALAPELDETPAARAEAEKIGGLLRDATRHARALARGLSPVEVEPQGLMFALQSLATQMELLFRIECQYACVAPVLVADHATAAHLYRIAQEAITNAVKHGHAERVEVTLEKTADGGRLTIADDGHGCTLPVPKSEGLGLRIMRYRAEMIGASLRLEPVPGDGMAVRCDFPTTSA